MKQVASSALTVGVVAGVLLGLFNATPARATPPRVRYDGDIVVSVPCDDGETFDGLLAELSAMGIEPLADHPRPGFLARVPGNARAPLNASGIAYTVIDPDLQATLELDHAQRQTQGGVERPTEGWDDDFRDFDEVLARLHVLAAAAPDIATIIDVGQSLEGREILGLRIARFPELPTALLNSGQHAREWLSVSTTMAIAEALVDSAAEATESVALLDPTTTERVDILLDDVAFIVVPVVNPDGYVYSWEVDRLWRKNRRDGHGVDLNRNWGVAWGGPGSSGDTSKNNYRGTAAFSEPEAAALRDLMRSETTLAAHIDFHAYGQLVLYPWGFGEALSPDDDKFVPLAGELADVLTDVHGEYYEPRRAGTWYAASGNLPDWAYGELGLRSFTIELRPMEAETAALGFVASATQILPTGQEALQAVLALAEQLTELPALPPGDDGDEPSSLDDESGSDSDGDESSDEGSTDAASETGAADPATTGPGTSRTDGAETEDTDGAAHSDDAAGGCSCRAPAGGSAPRWLWLVFLSVGHAVRPVRKSGENRRR